MKIDSPIEKLEERESAARNRLWKAFQMMREANKEENEALAELAEVTKQIRDARQ